MQGWKAPGLLSLTVAWRSVCRSLEPAYRTTLSRKVIAPPANATPLLAMLDQAGAYGHLRVMRGAHEFSQRHVTLAPPGGFQQRDPRLRQRLRPSIPQALPRIPPRLVTASRR